jgi:hypothetical protein
MDAPLASWECRHIKGAGDSSPELITCLKQIPPPNAAEVEIRTKKAAGKLFEPLRTEISSEINSDGIGKFPSPS